MKVKKGDSVDWICLVLDSFHWRNIEKAVEKFWVSQRREMVDYQLYIMAPLNTISNQVTIFRG
jgi:hypothetical protein